MNAPIRIAFAVAAACAGAERTKTDQQQGPRIELTVRRDPAPAPSQEGWSVPEPHGAPRPISFPEPEPYAPNPPLPVGEEGTALLRILVSPTGDVWDVELVEEKPEGHGLGASAVRYIRAVKFMHGAVVRGPPRAVRVNYVVRFR